MRIRIPLAMCVVALVHCAALPAQAQFDSPFSRDRDARDQDSNQAQSPENQARVEADKAYQSGNYKQVIDITTPLIDADPNDHVAFYLRASAKIELGRDAHSNPLIREGIADARRALAIGGNRYPWLYTPYFYGLTSLAEQEKRPDHAELVITIANPVLLRPDLVAADRSNLLYQRALAKTAKKDLRGAVDDYTEAVRFTPDHLGALVKRSAALAALGDQKAAQTSYDDAVRAFPNNVLVYNDRGTYLQSTGNYDGAISDFTRALQIDPKLAVGYVNRGVTFIDLNDPKAAEADLNEALRLNFRQPFVYSLRGSARFAQGNLKEALADYAGVIRMAPQDASALENHGFALFAAKDFTGAAADFAKVLQHDRQRVTSVPWQYLSLARAGQAEPAKAALEEYLKAAPGGWVAQICRFLQDRVTAEELLTAAKTVTGPQQNQRLCEANFFIGQKKLLAGDASGANEAFQAGAKTNAFMLAAFRCAKFELGEFKAQ